MTALATVEARADLIDELAEATRILRDATRRLAFALYADTSLLCADRARLGLANKLAGEVMGSLALLGTDQEGHE